MVFHCFWPKSKTDQHKEGHLVQLAATNSDLCPKAAFLHYLNMVPSEHKGPNAFAFFNLGSGTPVKRDTIIKLIRTMLVAAGHTNARSVTMHSFRIGCASTLAAKGLDSLNIRQLGRWKSNQSFDRYVRASLEHKQHISRALGLWTALCGYCTYFSILASCSEIGLRFLGQWSPLFVVPNLLKAYGIVH